MIRLRYTVINRVEEPMEWEHFLVVGEIRIDDKIYWVVFDPTQSEMFIREMIPAAGMEHGGLKKGNILASIDSDELWNELVAIAKKEGIIK